MLIITLIYTYEYDFGVFLFVLLLISVALYIQNEFNSKINDIKNSIYYSIFDIIKNMNNIYNKFDNSK